MARGVRPLAGYPHLLDGAQRRLHTPRLWDRLPTEPPQSYAAFLAYVALGARRSVVRPHIKTTSKPYQNHINRENLQRRGYDGADVVGLVGSAQVGES